jgi:tRNA nucleotidyltransferase/poly(A) polymerase
MEINLKVPAQVAEIIRKFSKNGWEIYIVGGVVRDIMLDRPLYDWDFTTNALPEQILELFPEAFYDNKYGTVGIPSSAEATEGQARPYEITTFRTEQGYSDSRHPDEVAWGKTLEEDLKRRDFTINAMALKQLKINHYQLIDLYGGEEDIKAGLIRCVGDASERFEEDALRMMRAIRIATQLKFAIEDETFTAIQKNAYKLKQISAERIRDELLKIMGSEYPADGYLLLRNTGLAAQVLPEMEGAFETEQKSPGRHHIYDVGTHSVESLRHCPSQDPITRLATLIHDAGKVKTQRKYPDGRVTFYNHEMESERVAREMAERLRFSNDDKDKFVRLVRWHQFTVDEHQTDTAVRRFIKNVGVENIPEMLALRTGDRLGGGARETSWRLEEFKKRLLQVQKQPFSIQDLKITGHDVMEVKGIEPGPAVGKYLEKLFSEVTEAGLPNEKEILLKRLGELSF